MSASFVVGLVLGAVLSAPTAAAAVFYCCQARPFARGYEKANREWVDLPERERILRMYGGQFRKI